MHCCYWVNSAQILHVFGGFIVYVYTNTEFEVNKVPCYVCRTFSSGQFCRWSTTTMKTASSMSFTSTLALNSTRAPSPKCSSGYVEQTARLEWDPWTTEFERHSRQFNVTVILVWWIRQSRSNEIMMDSSRWPTSSHARDSAAVTAAMLL